MKIDKRIKISLLTRFLFLLFTGISIFTPYYIYSLILLYFLYELGHLVNTYFHALNDFFDIDYEETFSQRQIVAFHFFLTVAIIIIGLIIIFYFENTYKFKILQGCYNKEIILINCLLFWVLKFTLMFYVLSKIHTHILINKLMGIENQFPPLTNFISNLIQKMKQEKI